jgi:hypothetical protein
LITLTYTLSRNLYGFSFNTPANEIDEGPDDYIGMLRMGMELGRFPYNTLSVAKNGIFNTGVLPESLNGPTSADLVRPLIGAIYILLGRTDGTYVLPSLERVNAFTITLYFPYFQNLALHLYFIIIIVSYYFNCIYYFNRILCILLFYVF